VPAHDRDVAFRGRGYDHPVHTPDGSTLAGVYARLRHPRGAAVGALLDPNGCLAFSASADPNDVPISMASTEPTLVGAAL
jgi:hypothetical protein